MLDQNTTVHCSRCGAERRADATFCSKCGAPVGQSPSSANTVTPNTVTPSPLKGQGQYVPRESAADHLWPTVLAWAFCGAVLLGVAFMLGCYHQYVLDNIAISPDRWPTGDSPSILYQRAIGLRDVGAVVGAALGGMAGFFKVIAGRRRVTR